jgi:hypothetical protein
LNNGYADPANCAVRQQLEARLLQWLVQTSDVTPYDTDARGF